MYETRRVLKLQSKCENTGRRKRVLEGSRTCRVQDGRGANKAKKMKNSLWRCFCRERERERDRVKKAGRGAMIGRGSRGTGAVGIQDAYYHSKGLSDNRKGPPPPRALRFGECARSFRHANLRRTRPRRRRRRRAE